MCICDKQSHFHIFNDMETEHGFINYLTYFLNNLNNRNRSFFVNELIIVLF